jgi:hypothetical protein
LLDGQTIAAIAAQPQQALSGQQSTVGIIKAMVGFKDAARGNSPGLLQAAAHAGRIRQQKFDLGFKHPIWLRYQGCHAGTAWCLRCPYSKENQVVAIGDFPASVKPQGNPAGGLPTIW